jgi:multicomponent Na+:H+ antiporter subunit G
VIWVDLLSWFLLAGGAAFCVIGGVGLLRLPEFFTRCHGAGITDTMGAGMILAGLMVQASDPLIIGKLLVLLVFIFVTSPVSGHALFKAAFAGGLRIGATMEDHTEGLAPEAPTVMLEVPEESE